MALTEMLGDRAPALKQRGEDATLYGLRAADMTRDELLIFIGMACKRIAEMRQSTREELDFMREIAASRSGAPPRELDPNRKSGPI